MLFGLIAENHYRILNERGEDMLIAKGHPEWFKSLSLTIHELGPKGNEILKVMTETDILQQVMLLHFKCVRYTNVLTLIQQTLLRIFYKKKIFSNVSLKNTFR